MLAARTRHDGQGSLVSSDKPVADYVRRGRRAAEQAGRRAVAPLVAVRRQRDELARTSAKLSQTRARLKASQEEVEHLKDQLRAARADRDARRASGAVETVLQRVRAENLTFLTVPALRDLALAAQDLEVNHMTGVVVEAGTARGGSAIVLAAAKAADRPMKVYDVFGLIPQPGERDGDEGRDRYRVIEAGEAKGPGGETYHGYRENLYEEVTESFARLGVEPAERAVELVKGRFEDTMRVDEPVALAHLDADWYASTMTCLERLAPLLVSGGRLVVDDYASSPGCRAAVEEYFRDRHMDFRFEQHQRLHVVRR